MKRLLPVMSNVVLMILIVGCLTAKADTVSGSLFLPLTTPTSGNENGGLLGSLLFISTPYGGGGSPFTLSNFSFDRATGQYSFDFRFDFNVDIGSPSGDAEGSITGTLPIPITSDIQDTWLATGSFHDEYECFPQDGCPIIVNSGGLVVYDFSLELFSNPPPGFYGELSVTLGPVPEPGTLALLIIGILPLPWISKHRRLSFHPFIRAR